MKSWALAVDSGILYDVATEEHALDVQEAYFSVKFTQNTH